MQIFNSLLLETKGKQWELMCPPLGYHVCGSCGPGVIEVYQCRGCDVVLLF